jgi:hypothetical protein
MPNLDHIAEPLRPLAISIIGLVRRPNLLPPFDF